MGIEKKDAPQQTPGGEPPAPAQTPDQAAAAAEKQKAEGTARAAAAQKTDQSAEQAEAVLATLGIEVKKAPQEGQPPMTVEQLEPVLQKAQPEQILELYTSLNGAVGDEEKTAFQEKYKDRNGSLDAARIGKDISEGKLPIRELIIFSRILDETPDLLSKQNEVVRQALEGASERCKALQSALEKQLQPKFSAEQVDAVFKKEPYKEAYKKFLADNKQDEFLAAITDPKDKETIAWAIAAEPTVKEKTAVAEKFKDIIAKSDPEAIGQAVTSDPPQMNFREGKIAKAILADLQRVAEESAIPDSIKGLGFMAILEKLIDQLSKLAGKISAAIEKEFAKKDKQGGEKPSEQPLRFAKSPLGEENGNSKKFTMARTWESGKGVEISAAPDTPIFAVGAGTLKEVGNNKVELAADNGRKVIYENIIIESVFNNTKVAAGAKIGKTGHQKTLSFRFFDGNGAEQNPEPLLADFVAEKIPAQAPAQSPASATPPPAPIAPSKAPPPPPPPPPLPS